jgi:exodeoxyribonuclease VII large subunit
MNLTAEHVYTPSELNREIKLHLEMGFPGVLLEAEISNLARPASGHLYFSLKDQRAQIRCAMFRSSMGRMRVEPENGKKVLARGRISLYELRGEYQMIVDSLEDAGEGVLQRQFDELKKKLQSEGLFEASRKKQIPSYPRRIALITSPSGAAVRDLVHVLQRRWPVAEVRLYPVPVQGAEAPQAICKAIESAGRHSWADTLITARGGGSLEDLAAFNDESVARCVFACHLPVISAVGHETDFSICDFVADLRAPTPSAAAELATPDQSALKSAFARSGRQLFRRTQDQLERETQKVDHLGHRMHLKHPVSRLSEQAASLAVQRKALVRNIDRKLQEREFALKVLQQRVSGQHPDRKLKELAQRMTSTASVLEKSVAGLIHSQRESLGNLARTLNAVSPLETINRGYAVITNDPSHEVISNTGQVNNGDRVIAQLKDGQLNCTVDQVVQQNAASALKT